MVQNGRMTCKQRQSLKSPFPVSAVGTLSLCCSSVAPDLKIFDWMIPQILRIDNVNLSKTSAHFCAQYIDMHAALSLPLSLFKHSTINIKMWQFFKV